MTLPPDLNFLHDATLRSLTVDWPSGGAAIELTVVGGGKCYITCADVTEVSVPRQAPWGPSVSVNTAVLSPSGLLAIEMQSGDTITIKANGIHLRSTDPV